MQIDIGLFPGGKKVNAHSCFYVAECPDGKSMDNPFKLNFI
jgi:hypothetical protein